MMRLNWRVHSALLFVQVAFGGFHVLGKFALFHLHPLAVAGARVAVAMPLLMLMAWAVDRCLPSPRDLPRLALLGLLGVFGNQLLFITGLQYTTATNAGILMPSIPVFAAAVAILGGVERFDRRRLAGVGLAVLGALVMLDMARISMARDTLLGNGLILINCLSYAAFLVLLKPMLKRLPPLTVIAWAFLFGGSGVLVVSIPRMLAVELSTVPTPVWYALAYLVTIPTVINYALNTWATGKSTPATVATYTTLQPVAAAIFAMMLLGEQAGWRELLGFILIVGGLVLVSRRSGFETQSRFTPRRSAP